MLTEAQVWGLKLLQDDNRVNKVQRRKGHSAGFRAPQLQSVVVAVDVSTPWRLRPPRLCLEGRSRNHDTKTKLKQGMYFPVACVLSVGKRDVCRYQPLQPLDLKMASQGVPGGALCGNGSRSSRPVGSPVDGTPCHLGRLTPLGGFRAKPWSLTPGCSVQR